MNVSNPDNTRAQKHIFFSRHTKHRQQRRTYISVPKHRDNSAPQISTKPTSDCRIRYYVLVLLRGYKCVIPLRLSRTPGLTCRLRSFHAPRKSAALWSASACPRKAPRCLPLEPPPDQILPSISQGKSSSSSSVCSQEFNFLAKHK